MKRAGHRPVAPPECRAGGSTLTGADLALSIPLAPSRAPQAAIDRGRHPVKLEDGQQQAEQGQ